MKQLAFKLSDNEIKFLDWYSKKTGTPMGSLYRQITLDIFNQWKIDHLLHEYELGAISFKQLCDIGSITFSEGMLLVEENNIEAPISSITDAYTELLTKSNIEKKDKSIYKDGKGITRKPKNKT